MRIYGPQPRDALPRSSNVLFPCDECGKTFTLRHNMLRHKRTHEDNDPHVCDGCKKTFSSKYNLEQHKKFTCRKIYVPILPQKILKKEDQKDSNFVEVETAFEKRIKTFSANTNMEGDLNFALEKLKPQIQEKIEECLRSFTSLKFNIFVETDFDNQVESTCSRSFKTKNIVVYRTSNLSDILSKSFEKLKMEKSECELKGSGWSFKKITRLELRINKYNPLRGSRFIALPKRVSDTKSVINVQNVDEYCFKYALLSKYCDVKDAFRISNYTNNSEFESKYKWDCVNFPVRLDDIKIFERVNNVSINVFGLDDTSNVYPLKVSQEELQDHFDLLYITNETTSHYCFINDFEKLIHHQFTKYHGKLRVCKRCFAHFDNRYEKTAEEKLAEHQRLCSEHGLARCEFPSYDKISFKNDHRSKKVRFVIYADFETLLVPIEACNGNPNQSWTKPYQQHVPYSYAYLLKDTEDEYTQLRVYRGPDAAKHFMKSILQDVQTVDTVLYANKKLDVPTLTTEQQHDFDTAETCHICKKGDFTPNNCKVRNHCHVSGEYLGVAHRHCNLFFQDQHFVPLFIHNLSGYDAHFIVRELGYDNANIKVIPNSEEKYISFSKAVKVQHAKNKTIEVRYLDSYRFMQSSLSTLAKNLPKEEYHETKKYFLPEELDLVTEKGVFPYEYMTDETKLNDTELPSKDAFYSHLSESHISDEMYDHAKRVWNTFDVKTLGEYSDIYVKTDVLLLCDIFENFRQTCMETYGLDPAYYYTVLGYSFDSMLRYTGVELELLQDMDMLLMVEKGIRGGITQCIKRHVVVNNKDLPDTFKKDHPSNYLWYIDANNLYGWAMSKYLPYGGFQWCDITLTDVIQTPEDADQGYILEVDLEYPKHLHDLHKDFPFCTETKTPPGGSNPKLLATVEDKSKYVIHYIALQQALKHGVVLKKIHRALKFNQKPWLKPFIDLNTGKRQNAKNDFEKDLYKLMSNSIYGKTMEQIRHRMDIRLVTDPKKAEKLIAKPNFIDRTIYSENLVGIHMGKTKLVFNKPIYIGMAILDISKTHMYSFHYDVMQPFYKQNLQLCYQDTDSFIYEIQTDDLYKDLEQLGDHLDTSDYPSTHPLQSSRNKKVLGKFKDELSGDVMVAFVGLRSKVYAIKKKDSTIRKIKGIQKSSIKKCIHFGDYVKCLYKGNIKMTPNNTIRSKQHIVQSVTTNKITLSSNDDKRFILEDKVNTLPHGHWRLEEPPMKKQKL